MSLAPYMDWLRDSQPPWLAQPNGRAWFEAYGLLWDIIVDAARKAVLARFIATAPDDALPLVASERNLEAMPGESTNAWRGRLAAAWQAWPWAGTKKGVRDALALTGPTNIVITEAWDTALPGQPVTEWARFAVIIEQPHTWTTALLFGRNRPGTSAVPTYGDGAVYGLGNATTDQMQRLRRLVRLWKPAHAHCNRISIVVSGTVYGSGQTYGDGSTYGADAATIRV